MTAQLVHAQIVYNLCRRLFPSLLVRAPHDLLSWPLLVETPDADLVTF